MIVEGIFKIPITVAAQMSCRNMSTATLLRYNNLTTLQQAIALNHPYRLITPFMHMSKPKWSISVSDVHSISCSVGMPDATP